MATRDEGNSSISCAMSLIREAAAVLNNNSPENRENSSSSTGSSLNAVEHWNINTNTSNSAIHSSTSTSCTPVTNVCANTPNTQETLKCVEKYIYYRYCVCKYTSSSSSHDPTLLSAAYYMRFICTPLSGSSRGCVIFHSHFSPGLLAY